jgi:hypothetical protein
MGTMDLGSWFTQSSLSTYVGDHVIDNRSKNNYHALMITLWRLYVLKHIVKRSTHMCSGVTPECGQVTPPHHTSPFLPPERMLSTPFWSFDAHIHHTLKGKHILSSSAMIYNICAFTTLPSTYTWWCQAPHDMIDKASSINKFIACIIGVIPKYDKP